MSTPDIAPAPAEAPAARLFTPAFIFLALCELAYFTAAGLTIPVTPLFAEGPLRANELWVGITVGSFSVTAVALRPLAGRLSDRRGRRPLLIGGAVLCAATLAAHALTSELWMLIALRLILGVAEAFFFVGAFAALADLAPPGRAGEALSFNSLALYLGIALGPFLGERLLDFGGFGVAWIGGAVLVLIATALALPIGETAPRNRAEAPDTPLFHPAAIGPGLAIFAGTAAMGGFLGFVALHADDVGMAGSGPVLLLFGLVVITCRVLFARLPDRVPPFRLAAAALVAAAGGMAVTSLFASAPGLLAGAALLAVGMAFLTPAIFAATLSRVPAGERGSAMATVSVFIDLAFGAGPILVGFIAGLASIPAGFAAAAALALVAAVGVSLSLGATRARRAQGDATG
ncbi:MAG TPA: MFS transporter [Candidatus Limnocylindria bacterium]|nr:MFS transporter [Candidatus Limnocylindria bacterium]